MKLSYRDALHYIYSFTDYEKRGFAAYAPEFYDLQRVQKLLSLLGNPERCYQIVHIAGTKGKGSTAAIAESILRAAGCRTGLFTSPHLHTFRERMQAAGALASERDVVRMVRSIQPAAAQVSGITTFEIMTAMALQWFAEQSVEWAVLEVGLGGRLDATNVVTPAVSIITSISLDHTAILGDTVAKIAAEKAGIVKQGVPTVSAPQVPEALEVIEAACRHQSAPLTLVGVDWTWQGEWANLDGQALTVRHGREQLPSLWLPLLGEHQLVNATTAIAALSLLTPAGVGISEQAIRRGLGGVTWPGRLEVLSRDPLLVVDSAHNGDSAQKLRAALGSLCKCQRLTVVLGTSEDHLTRELLWTLASGAQRVIATHSRHPRAADAAWIQARAEELGLTLEVSDTVPQALDLALTGAATNDLICCTGSVFVAAEARAAWFARQGLPRPPSDPV
jgi:dihydrofolate synthase/folylpolyglutamate synthase